MIKLNYISVSFSENKVISDLSLELEENAVYCIMGPSGAGKTTLMKVLSGLLKPSNGSVSGIENKRKSFIFQENRLISWLSVYDNIKYITDDEKSIEMSLKNTGLFGDKNKMPGELSGGMARRVAIARAAAFGGDIFFIDEPLYGLDIKTSEGILSLIKETVKGKTAFIVTHSPEEAFVLADKIIFLKKSPIDSVEIKDITDFSSQDEIKNYLKKD